MVKHPAGEPQWWEKIAVAFGGHHTPESVICAATPLSAIAIRDFILYFLFSPECIAKNPNLQSSILTMQCTRTPSPVASATMATKGSICLLPHFEPPLSVISIRYFILSFLFFHQNA
jgi:hypothetical protein